MFEADQFNSSSSIRLEAYYPIKGSFSAQIKGTSIFISTLTTQSMHIPYTPTHTIYTHAYTTHTYVCSHTQPHRATTVRCCSIMGKVPPWSWTWPVMVRQLCSSASSTRPCTNTVSSLELQTVISCLRLQGMRSGATLAFQYDFPFMFHSHFLSVWYFSYICPKVQCSYVKRIDVQCIEHFILLLGALIMLVIAIHPIRFLQLC